ncbi:hypothetical protein ABBQ38_014867 [Trebouxia sp. C0009 RCD-2024]
MCCQRQLLCGLDRVRGRGLGLWSCARQHQLELGISVAAATQTTTHVPLAVLLPLVPFIHAFDTYSIPSEQPSAFTTTKVRSQVSGEHIWELSKSQLSVCTFYLSTENDDAEFIKSRVVTAIASMSNLTKLHITIDDKLESINLDFQPLSKLSLITNFALQIVHKGPTCCEGILSSNRQTLEFVTLTASSWTASTYCSLQHVAQLKTLNLTIMEIDTAQAQALAGITAGLFSLTLHGSKAVAGFRALYDSQSQVHELTVRHSFDHDSHILPDLPFLQRLTFRECIHLSGKSVPLYPQAKRLTLIGCPKISGVGLQHMIRKALPALEVISFLGIRRQDTQMHLSVHAFDALQFGPNLHSIHLRGVSGLTNERVAKLVSKMQRKQGQGKVQPRVTLLLPSVSLDKPDEVLESCVDALLPNLFKLPNSPHVNTLILNKQ